MSTGSFNKLCRAIVISCAAAFMTGGLAPPALAANPNLFFELDGNMLSNSAAGPDWSDIFQGLLPLKGATNKTLAGFSSQTFIPDFNTDDTKDNSLFATGSKDTLNVTPGWECKKTNNVNDKTDINNAYAVATQVDHDSDSTTPKHLIIYFALDVASNEGTKDVAFWFLKDPTVSCDPGSGNTPFVGNHTDGDILIVSEFTSGGRVSEIKAYRWNGGADGSLGTTPISSGGECSDGAFDVCAEVNDVVLNGTGTLPGGDVPWLVKTKQSNPTSSAYNATTDLDIGEFFEGGIDLTALGISGCFNRYLADTRSSTSLTATIFDFALGNFSNCSIAATKTCQAASVRTATSDFTSPFTVTITNDGPAGGTVYDASFKETFNFGQTGETCKITSVTGTGTAVVDTSKVNTQIESGNLVKVATSLNQGDSVIVGISCTGTLNSFEDSIQAVASSAPNSGLDDITKNAAVSAASAQGCQAAVTGGLLITKVCKGMQLVKGGTLGDNEPLALKANVRVEVTNDIAGSATTNENVTINSLSDNKVGGSGTIGNFTQVACFIGQTVPDLVLSPGETACFTGSYIPTNADLVNPPSTAGFTDTAKVTGVGSISGTFPAPGDPDISASATCKLCDSDLDGIPDLIDLDSGDGPNSNGP